MAENNPQKLRMTLFQTQIVTQRKISRFLPSQLIENE